METKEEEGGLWDKEGRGENCYEVSWLNSTKQRYQVREREVDASWHQAEASGIVHLTISLFHNWRICGFSVMHTPESFNKSEIQLSTYLFDFYFLCLFVIISSEIFHCKKTFISFFRNIFINSKKKNWCKFMDSSTIDHD